MLPNLQGTEDLVTFTEEILNGKILFFCSVTIIYCKTLDLIRIGIIHLVRTENFPKNYHFLPPDTHTYVRVLTDGKKC